MSNPFFEPLPASGIPRFDLIRFEHYEEAFDRAFDEWSAEIEAVVAEDSEPTFINTIEALERCGGLFQRVADVFFNQTSSATSDELQAMELEVMPRMAAQTSRIYTNLPLFRRVKAVVDGEETLDAEQLQLMQEVYQRFVRAGAELDEAGRASVSEINEQLAGISARFGQNVLKDVASFELVLNESDDVAGLPDSVLAAAKEEGESRGQSGKYVFTISRSSITPFLQFAENRDLREKIYKAYTNAGQMEVDNKPVIKEIVRLRDARARLMGFENHAAFMLDDRMAKNTGNVRKLLDQVWEPAQRKVAEEAADLQERIQQDGGNFQLEPWDWLYYTEKVRQERFDLEDAEVKPFFLLENVRDGAFEVARKLYGIVFERVDAPVYHPDVEVYQVTDEQGDLVGHFLFDFFMRSNKYGGAWMSAYRSQSNLDEFEHPVIVNNCNFPKSNPCLLGMDEVRTLFHEFGHGLHGLLSKVRYLSLSGTEVKQDFVELPSQIMEHWAIEPEVLRSYARHFETGEPISEGLIEKLREAGTFNQGFATTEYLAACYLDLAWHEQADGTEEVESFEATAMADIHKIRMIDPRYRSTYFRHIFDGESYSAGYYVYIWAEVLDADAFESFKSSGIFDAETARSFRENILEKGGTVDPMEAYRAFKGRDPEVAPLLRNRGLA